MTIAACYVSPEGVVLGADSTTTNYVPHPNQPIGESHYFNYGQKIFEIGENSSIGISTWGLGSFRTVSYRTLIANLGDQLGGIAPQSMAQVSALWSTLYWAEYSRVFSAEITNAQNLIALGAARTPDQEAALDNLLNDYAVGFCVGGHTEERRPEAYELSFTVGDTAAATPAPIRLGYPRFWGWGNLMHRLNYGLDDGLFQAILNSGHWTGTENDLTQIALDNRLAPAVDLPLRDAIDWVYSSIYTTIKAIKFSYFSPACGGPIELAVITTDRNFRWVCHKSLDAAIN